MLGSEFELERQFFDNDESFLRPNIVIFEQKLACSECQEQGWHQKFSDRGADSSDKGAKISFQGIVNAKNLRKNSFSRSDGGLVCSDRGARAPSSPPLAPPLVRSRYRHAPITIQVVMITHFKQCKVKTIAALEWINS